MLSLSKPEIRLTQEGTTPAAKSHLGLVFAFFLALLFLCYSPVLSRQYAFADDFHYLAQSIRATGWPSDVMRQALLQGRPFDGLALDLAFLCIHRVSDLVWLRVAGIIGASCVALCSYVLLLKTGWPKVQSFCLSFCFVTIPSFQVYISWAVAASHVFPACAACLAAMLTASAQSRTGKSKVVFLISACTLMFFAIGLYQPSAMFFWLFAAILTFGTRVVKSANRDLKQHAKLFAWLLLVFGGACVLELIVFESAKHCFGTASLLPQRSHLTTHIGAKIGWFIQGPLVDALNFYKLQPSVKVACVVFSFIVIGQMLYFTGKFYERSIQVALALLLIPLSYLPNLAIAEDFVTYRTEAGLAALLIFYLFLAAVGFVQRSNAKRSPVVITTLTILAALSSLLYASYNVNTFFVQPQSLELALIKCQLTGAFGDKAKANPVMLKRDDTLAPFSRYDEFGLPSLCQPWVPDPVMFLIKQGLVEVRALDIKDVNCVLEINR